MKEADGWSFRAKFRRAAFGWRGSHLAMELFKRASGIQLMHVPYKGSSQALADVVAGHVPMMFDSVVSSSGHVKAGRLRALGVSTAARLPGILRQPDVVERYAVQGAPVPPAMTPAQVAAFVRNDVAIWRKLVSEAGIHAD